MRLHRAWIVQASSDVIAASALRDVGADACQVMAKCQQTVEKSVKALIEALNNIGFLTMPVDRRHDVSRYLSGVLTAAEAAAKEHRLLRGDLKRLFPQHIREVVKRLDGLVPQYPSKGELAVRNTEYPFQTSASEWRAPCGAEVFSPGEVRRALHAARQVQGGAAKILSGLERTRPTAMGC